MSTTQRTAVWESAHKVCRWERNISLRRLFAGWGGCQSYSLACTLNPNIYTATKHHLSLSPMNLSQLLQAQLLVSNCRVDNPGSLSDLPKDTQVCGGVRNCILFSKVPSYHPNHCTNCLVKNTVYYYSPFKKKSCFSVKFKNFNPPYSLLEQGKGQGSWVFLSRTFFGLFQRNIRFYLWKLKNQDVETLTSST